MRDKNIQVDLQIWEGLWHVFEWDSELPESEKSLKNISNFLTSHMV
jgi:acetyl esterase/lipase